MDHTISSKLYNMGIIHLAQNYLQWIIHLIVQNSLSSIALVLHVLAYIFSDSYSVN